MGRAGKASVKTIAAALLALALGACAPFPEEPGTAYPPPAAPASGDTPTAEIIVNAARNSLGTPYRYGGNGPSGFDCSGLVQYTHARAGVRVPRTVADQQAAATPVGPDALQPGDLLFFRLSGWKPSHVGIYVGQGRFIHAPSSGGAVRYDHIQERFWTRHFDSAGRFHAAGCCGDTAAR